MLLAITVCYLGTLVFLAYTMTYFMMYGTLIRGVIRGFETMETIFEPEEQPPAIHIFNNVKVSATTQSPQESNPSPPRPKRDYGTMTAAAMGVTFAISKLVLESLGYQAESKIFDYENGASWVENILGVIRRGIGFFVTSSYRNQTATGNTRPVATPEPAVPEPAVPEPASDVETDRVYGDSDRVYEQSDRVYEQSDRVYEETDRAFEGDQPISSVPTWGEFMDHDTCLGYLRTADSFEKSTTEPGMPFETMTPQEVYDEIASFSESEIKLCDIVNNQSNISRYLRLLVINHVGYAQFQEMLTELDNEIQEEVYCSDNEDDKSEEWEAYRAGDDENGWSDGEEPSV